MSSKPESTLPADGTSSSTSGPPRRTRPSSLGAKAVLLVTLYASQGLPYGFFNNALPVVLRHEKATLTAIGFSSLLSIPWVMKALWAPLIDRFPNVRGGRRRCAILMLQTGLAASLFLLAGISPDATLRLLIVGVVVTNLFSATQDIATDALATEMLTPKERGIGNGIQVAAYRLGMIGGGAGLLIVYDHAGHAPTFLLMGTILVVLMIPILLVDTTPFESPRPVKDKANAQFLIAAFLRRAGVGPWLAVLVLFKASDSFMTAMVKPMLVDRGFTLTEIAATQGGVGSAASLIGAMAGGALLVVWSRRRAFITVGVAQGLAQLVYLWPAAGTVTVSTLTILTVVENFVGGMATAILFTWMMDRCAPSSAGTDYTFQASTVVIAMGLGGIASGASADALGHSGHLIASGVMYGAALAVVVIFLLPRAVATDVDSKNHVNSGN